MSSFISVPSVAMVYMVYYPKKRTFASSGKINLSVGTIEDSLG